MPAKLPHLTLVDDLESASLPPQRCTVIHADSVFSHSPLPVIEECLAHDGLGGAAPQSKIR